MTTQIADDYMLAQPVSSTSIREGNSEEWRDASDTKDICFAEKSLSLDYHDRVYLPSQDGGVEAKEYLHK